MSDPRPVTASFPASTRRTGLLAASAVGLALSLGACASLSAANLGEADGWPHPGDIPVAAPMSPGLAGEGAPDIARFLKVRGVVGARLSPDGETLAFRINTTGEPQLWTVPAEGGWPNQLTVGGAVSTHAWTPDGARLLYGADREGDERLGLTLISPDGAKETTALPYSDAFIAPGVFSPNGERFAYSTTARNGVDFDVHVLDLTTGEDRLVYEGAFGYFVEAWRPGSSEIVVSVTRGEDANDLVSINVETGALTTLFEPEVASAYEDIAFTPDGSGFYLVTDHEREHRALAFYDLRAGRLEMIAAPEGMDVDQAVLAGKGRWLAWTTNEGGYSRLHAVDLEDGAPIAPPVGLPAGVYQLHAATEAPALAITVGGPQTPGDVFVWNPAVGTYLHHAAPSMAAGLALDALIVPDSVFFEASDGVTLNGLLYMPPDTAAPPPVLVTVHGGPTAQARPDFDAVTQYLAAQGIAVFDLNFRGSTGFGKTFARLDNQMLRRNAVRDVAEAVGYLARRGDVDASRAAVMGGSYGGYLTNAVLGEHPDVFKAGVSFVGVSDWVHALETASPALKASDQVEYGDIADPEVRAFHAALSPINTVDAITARVMVLHGANDPRDPVAESDRLVAALRANGAEVAYLRFPDEGHGIRKVANRIAAYRQVVAFLKEALDVEGADAETTE